MAISETKLGDEFPDEQFSIEGYSFPPYRRDRNQHGGGPMVFIKKDVVTKRLIELNHLLLTLFVSSLRFRK